MSFVPKRKADRVKNLVDRDFINHIQATRVNSIYRIVVFLDNGGVSIIYIC